MARVRPLLGIVAGLTMIASFAAHSFLGWPALAAALAQDHVPADLVRGLAIGWHFGGSALALSRDPFFFIFIVPGLMLAAASFGGTSLAATLTESR